MLLGSNTCLILFIKFIVVASISLSIFLVVCRSTFNPTFLGLSGDLQTTRNIAKEFKIAFQKQSGTTQDSYIMEHSTGVYIFDPKGKLRLYVNSGTNMDIISHDILELLRTS